MNGINFLIDTNIIIYLTQGRLKISDFAKNNSNLYISSITYIETLGYPFSNQDEERTITDFCDTFERVFLTSNIEKQTIQIRKKYKIKLPDAIIAATAIIYNLTLVTLNSSDFDKISELNILVPHKLAEE